METLLTAFIVIALILFAALTVFNATMQAQENLYVGWQEVQTRMGDQLRTNLTPIAAATQSSGSVVEITLRNEGGTRLMDFQTWDVIVQYNSAPGDYWLDWLTPLTGEPGHGEWSVVGLYTDAAALENEIYEPDILNPDEEILIRLRLLPPVGPNTTNLVNITTSNGIGTTVQFTR